MAFMSVTVRRLFKHNECAANLSIKNFTATITGA